MERVEVVKDRQEVGERILTYCMWDSSECELSGVCGRVGHQKQLVSSCIVAAMQGWPETGRE